MKKIIACLLFCTAFYTLIISQEHKRNIIFAEAPGATGVYSVNYERILTNSEYVNFSLRIGLAFLTEGMYSDSHLPIPLSFSMLKPIDKGHHLELRLSLTSAFSWEYRYRDGGQGGAIQIRTDKKKLVWGMLPGYALGYRYQPSDKRIFINCLYQNILGFDEHWYQHLSTGVGISF